MKIGFPIHPRKDILKEIDWIGENGFDFVDLYLEEDCAVPEKIPVAKVKALLKKYNLDVKGHTAQYLPIGSPSKIIRDAAFTEMRRYLPVFHKLGVKYVTVHSFWPPFMFSVDDGIRFQIETLKRIVKEAKRYKITMMLEAGETNRDMPENIERIVNKVPGLYVHIDIGHANLCGRKPDEIIKKFHKKLKHIHLDDNDGREDLHIPMGAGLINWNKLIPVLKKHYNGTITLEIFSPDKDYALISKEKLQLLWEKS